MWRSINRRLDRIQLAIPVPITLERYLARVRQHVQRTGASLEAALATLVRDLSDNELDSLCVEFERIRFGSDTAARDAARQAFLDADAVQLGFSQ